MGEKLEISDEKNTGQNVENFNERILVHQIQGCIWIGKVIVKHLIGKEGSSDKKITQKTGFG